MADSYTFARFLAGLAPLIGDLVVVEFSDDDADDEMF